MAITRPIYQQYQRPEDQRIVPDEVIEVMVPTHESHFRDAVSQLGQIVVDLPVGVGADGELATSSVTWDHVPKDWTLIADEGALDDDGEPVLAQASVQEGSNDVPEGQIEALVDELWPENAPGGVYRFWIGDEDFSARGRPNLVFLLKQIDPVKFDDISTTDPATVPEEPQEGEEAEEAEETEEVEGDDD